MWDYPYFSQEEMRCKCGCGGLPKDAFMKRLVTIREEADFPFIITSGFRCPLYNEEVATSGSHGPHTKGVAADIKVHGNDALRLVYLAVKHGMTGIGVSQKGTLGSRYIHLDCLDNNGTVQRPWIWSY